MNLLARKLEHFGLLDDEDRRLLDEITRNPRLVKSRTDLICEGDKPDNVHLIIDGFACRYKFTSEGNRSIMAYLVPGDFCDLHVAILGEMDHSIATLSDCEVVDIPRATVTAMTNRLPLARALWWATLVDEAVLREWLVNVGTRDAEKAIAHLFCEMLFRLRAVGLVAQGHSFDLPITQEELGNTIGLSTVHVNRTLGNLRNAGLITFEHKRLTVLDVDRLIELSGFNANYLHLTTKK